MQSNLNINLQNWVASQQALVSRHKLDAFFMLFGIRLSVGSECSSLLGDLS